jgi:hypothetical protein
MECGVTVVAYMPRMLSGCLVGHGMHHPTGNTTRFMMMICGDCDMYGGFSQSA